MIIHYLTNPKFLGDKNQAYGIAIALTKRHPDGVFLHEWDDSKPEDLAKLQAEIAKKPKDPDQKGRQVVIASGDHGLEALKQLKLPKSKVVTVYSSHQVFPELYKVKNKIDVIALPAHIVTPEVREILESKNAHVVATKGVSHNVTSFELDQALSDWQKTSKTPIQKSKRYVGVILGGDAPDPDKKMHYFTPEEGAALGRFLAFNAFQFDFFLITNSPRTGKYDPKTGLEQKVHVNEELDATTKALLAELDKQKVKYQFFNYVAGKPSAYKAILGAVKTSKDSGVVVTGDSTSMITEISDSLKNTLIVVNVGSMNPDHASYVRWAREHGFVREVTLNLEDKNGFRGIRYPEDYCNLPKASEAVADGVIEALQKTVINEKPNIIYSREAGVLFSYNWKPKMPEPEEDLRKRLKSYNQI